MDTPYGNARFPTTHWSLVGRAAQDASEAKRRALDELLVRYQPALRAHLIYGKRLQPEDAEDLLQEFVACKILANELLAGADAQLGKFRTFLLTALDRFLIDRFRREQTRAQSPGRGRLQALGQEAEQLEAGRSSDAFDLAWARHVIEQTVRIMRDECEKSGRADVWGVFQSRLLAPILDGVEPIPYEDLVRQWGLQSPSHASNLLITAKRMFARAIRVVVGEYVAGSDDSESEIRELMEILARGRS